MQSKGHCDCCEFIFYFHVMSSHTQHRAFMYMWARPPASLTPSFLSEQAISLQDDTQVKILSTADRIPPVEIWIFHCANPPSPTPPPSHLSPAFPKENPWTPQASSQRSSHDRIPVQVTFLNLRLSSHLIFTL